MHFYSRAVIPEPLNSANPHETPACVAYNILFKHFIFNKRKTKTKEDFQMKKGERFSLVCNLG